MILCPVILTLGLDHLLLYRTCSLRLVCGDFRKKQPTTKQLSYEDLVDQVTTLLEERPDDLEAARNAMELQDNINGIYDR